MYEGLVYQSRSPGINYLDRIDPLYEIAWDDAIRTRWQDISTLEHVLATNTIGQIVHRDRMKWSPVSLSSAKQYHPNAIRLVALLGQFHQLTTLQLCTLLGTSVQQVWNAASNLYAAGVVERAIPEWWREDERPHGGSGSLWRIDTRSPRLPEWLDGLEDLEWLLLTGGRDLTKGTAGSTSRTVIRHNVATTEIVTRALELCPGVLGAWGEAAATAELLMHGSKRSDEQLRRNIADAALVTRDGTVIVVETSGASNMDSTAVGQRIADKAAAWGAVAARSDLPIKVLFVDASQHPRPGRFRWHVLRGVEGSNRYLSRTRDQQTARRSVFVADAHDWFPIPSGVDLSFLTLRAWSPADDSLHDLVPVDTQLDPSSDVVVNTLAALHTPTWVVEQPLSLVAE